jgi:hypothetical protein
MPTYSKYPDEGKQGKKRKCIKCRKKDVVGFRYCTACKQKVRKMNIGMGA